MSKKSSILKNANDNIPHSLADREDIIKNAAVAYASFLDALKIDWRSDPHSKNTPQRVAKAYVNDLICGCYQTPPVITAFDNNEQYDGMVCQTNIKVVSLCAHHHLPFTGVAHVAYIPTPNGKVIGLSKLNRIVEWFARRPQVQESLTMQIHEYIDQICKLNRGVAVLIEARHSCCANRGIKHDSTMRTSKVSGAFLENDNLARTEFYKFVEFAQNHRDL